MPEEAPIEAWFAAVEAGDLKAADDLLRRGVAVDATDEIGNTTLRSAVHRCRIDMIRFLLDRGADPNHAHAPGGCTPTTEGVERAHPKFSSTPDRRPLDLLVAAGGRLGLREAVLLGDVDLARRLCDADPGLDVNEVYWRDQTCYLIVATELDTPEMVRLLLDRGADIERTDEYGATALIVAAFFGNLALVTLFLDRGADINHADWAGETPLYNAADANHRDVFDLLIARGARRTLLDAAQRGEAALVGSILDAGADPWLAALADYAGRVLIAAVLSRDATTVRVVLDQVVALGNLLRPGQLWHLVKIARMCNREAAPMLLDWEMRHETGPSRPPRG